MELRNILLILEVIISIAVVITILLQQKEGGLSSTFGGAGGGEGYRTKRGLELFLTRATVFLIIAFVINSLVLATLSN